MGNNASEVRKIDQLGRIVIPKTIREALGVGEGDSLSVKLEDGRIVLDVYEQACVFCGSTSGLVDYMGKAVCQKCRDKLTK